ncbi:MAG: hypothetical protein K0S38_451 [Candidatus Paceibacter sp.]|jgi:broad-specificity NMP kinase|nr:hypothetical protein [Candidatus Paceibacter sp.]
MSIFFISGTSGTGKTTLMKIFQKKLPANNFVVYDFEENGMPVHPDTQWRKVTSEYWLDHAYRNAEQKINTIICGMTVPSEVMKAYNYNQTAKIYFGLVTASPEVIKNRLSERGWNEKMVQDSTNMQKRLEKEVAALPNDLIIESKDSVDASVVAQTFMDWILKHDEFRPT